MGEAKRRRAHCAYCGAPKVSEDHVPPKNIFSADRKNLITVPSCYEHNGKWSDLDEKFRGQHQTALHALASGRRFAIKPRASRKAAQPLFGQGHQVEAFPSQDTLAMSTIAHPPPWSFHLPLPSGWRNE
jgi:hypothetical protein